MPQVSADAKKRGRPSKTDSASKTSNKTPKKGTVIKLKLKKTMKEVKPVLKIDNPSSYYYFFSPGKADGNAQMRDELGGKGANLAEMALAKIAVPPGFTIATSACKLYYDNDLTLPLEIDAQLEKYVAMIEKETRKKFGDNTNPLLLSVRSGAKF